MSETPLPDDCTDLRLSARFVYRELQRADGSLPVTTLRNRMACDPSTIRRAVTALEDADLVESRWQATDPRVRIIELR